jgi:hypothetical protein
MAAMVVSDLRILGQVALTIGTCPDGAGGDRTHPGGARRRLISCVRAG